MKLKVFVGMALAGALTLGLATPAVAKTIVAKDKKGDVSRTEAGAVSGKLTVKQTAKTVTLPIPSKAIKAPPKIWFHLEARYTTESGQGTRIGMAPHWKKDGNGYITTNVTATR